MLEKESLRGELERRAKQEREKGVPEQERSTGEPDQESHEREPERKARTGELERAGQDKTGQDKDMARLCIAVDIDSWVHPFPVPTCAQKGKPERRA